MRGMSVLPGLALLAVVWMAGPVPPASPPPASPWRMLEPGLELGEFPAPAASDADDAVIRIVRISLDFYDLRLLNASQSPEGHPRTAREWAQRYHLAAAINASMYQADLRRSVSLMRTPGHVNNPRLSKDKAVLAFDRIAGDLPKAQIIDRECQDFETLSRGYGTLVQSIRMISCTGRNVWVQQPQAWSAAAIGFDRSGRVLFIHARAPRTTHDLIDILLGLPIDLKNAMYAEGGPEAQMVVRGGGQEHEFTGLLSGSGGAGTSLAWPIPNVVGAVRRNGAPLIAPGR